MHDMQIDDRLQRDNAKCNFTVLLQPLGSPTHRMLVLPLEAHWQWLANDFFLTTGGGGATEVA
jgi:hypothetical protein